MQEGPHPNAINAVILSVSPVPLSQLVQPAILDSMSPLVAHVAPVIRHVLSVQVLQQPVPNVQDLYI
jgi:hypothetical protein